MKAAGTAEDVCDVVLVLSPLASYSAKYDDILCRVCHTKTVSKPTTARIGGLTHARLYLAVLQ